MQYEITVILGELERLRKKIAIEICFFFQFWHFVK